MDMLEVLEGRRGRRGEDSRIEVAYGSLALVQVADIAREQQRFDEAFVYFQRTEEALEAMAHDPGRLSVIVALDISRRKIAGVFGRRGQSNSRRRLLETHIRMLDRLNDSGGGEPAIGLLAALSRAELASDATTIATLRAEIQKFPPNERLSEMFEMRLADWIANDIRAYSFGLVSNGAPTGTLDPDAHADMSIEALESRCKSLGVHPAMFPLAAHWLGTIASGVSTEHRAAGRLDDARVTAACLSAFAKKLVRRNPAEAWFHVLLSEACAQDAKNAWKVEDFPTIEAATRSALAAACTALHLDPRNKEARAGVCCAPGQDGRSDLPPTTVAVSSGV